VGTATLQVAKGLGARTIAVVSSDEKERVARDAGADEVVRADGFKDAVKELGGADLIVDPVGGDRFTDSLRSLAPNGRLVVLGFTGGEIPTVKVNRLLLRNISVLGAGWGEYVRTNPGYTSRQWATLGPLLESGALQIAEPTTYSFEHAGDALRTLETRSATGKIALSVRPS
jgi:NADPH2:quinone reductase